MGVTNTLAEFMEIWCKDAILRHYGRHLSEAEMTVMWFSIVSIFLIGGICGSFLGAWICNQFGRKCSLVISAILLIMAGFLLHFCRAAYSVEMLILGRLIGGIAAGFIFAGHPMYLLEISPVELRGSVGAFTGIGVTAGIMVGQIMSLPQLFGNEPLWEFALSAYTLIVVLSLLPFYWFPESPHWLAAVKKDTRSAHFELQRLRGSAAQGSIPHELAQMQHSTCEESRKMSLCQVLRSSELLLPLVLVCSFQTCQQLCGINAIFYYSVTIFTTAGFSREAAAWINLSAGFLNTVFALLGCVLMARVNRRPLMLSSCMGCAISLCIMAFSFDFIEYASWLPIASLAVFIFFFQIGLCPIPFFIGSEIFDLQSRGVAMSIGGGFSWTGNFLMGMFFPMLLGTWNSYAFLLCCAVCVAGFLLTWRYLPETRGRTLNELKDLLKDGFGSKVK